MKNITIAITGGVAIYKTLSLIRILKKNDYDVRCVMTDSACKLISPQLFASVSGNYVRTKMFSDDAYQIEHIDLSRWSDLVMVVPATANIIGKMANGIADDLVSTMLMASDKRIMIAPAMNVEMWKNKAVQRNLEQLRQDGIIIIEPGSGLLACGVTGPGKLEKPEKIFEKIEEFFNGEKGCSHCGTDAGSD